MDPVREVVVGAPSYLAFTYHLVPRERPNVNLVSDGTEPFNENYGARYCGQDRRIHVA